MKLQFFLVFLVATLLASAGARADMSLIVLERTGWGGIIFGSGHSAMHLSHVCADGSPVKLRMCGAGEAGVVIQRYDNISAEKYDWFATPANYFFYGVADTDKIPFFGNPKVSETLLGKAVKDLNMASVMNIKAGAELPEGAWKNSLNQAFRRTSFIFTLEDTIEDERKIVEKFNSSPNKEKFNVFWSNCSDHTRNLMKIAFPETSRGIGSLGMTSPKGLAQEAVRLARKNNPEGLLVIDKIEQLPGTYNRSSDNLYPLENAFRNKYYAVPTAIFVPELFVGSVLFHTIINPFSIPREYKNYATPELARLSLRQAALRDEQDKLMAQINSLRSRGGGRELMEVNVRAGKVYEELQSLKKMKDQEWSRAFGSDATWKEFKTRYQALAGRISSQLIVPAEVRQIFDRHLNLGDLSDELFKLFHERGTYGFDSDGAVVMRLTLTDDRIRQSGMTRANITEGDDLVSLLILMANADYYLSAGWKHRDSLEKFQAEFGLLREAACRLQVCE
jgi:hypothetical protein